MGRSSKDKRDIFYRLAKEEGWRARSAFKLLQIQETLNILDSVTRAVDLCAAPGSWSQVLAQTLMPKNEGDEKPYIVAVDLQTMSPIPGVKCIKGDITSEETALQIIDALGGSKAQIVVCDGAPDVTGLHELDERLQTQLLFAALSIATCILEENGTFVSKFFRASDEGIRFNFSRVKYFFEDVTLAKPRSSRASSMECFIVGRKFHLPEGFVPKVAFPDWPRDIGIESAAVPFVACGDLSGFDSETTYPLPPDYVLREPVQKPIDPPYAAAVELRKTEKLSNKTRDLGASSAQTSTSISQEKLTDAKYTVNTEKVDNPSLVETLENLRLCSPEVTQPPPPLSSPPVLNTKAENKDVETQGTSTDSQDRGSDSNVFTLKAGVPETQNWTELGDSKSSSVSASNRENPKLNVEAAPSGIIADIEPFITVKLSFRGGLEIIFGGLRDLEAKLPPPPPGENWTMELLLEWMKNNVIQERPELFIKDGDIRPGILIFINDTDWELFEKLDYELAQGDRISFISTLHGG